MRQYMRQHEACPHVRDTNTVKLVFVTKGFFVCIVFNLWFSSNKCKSRKNNKFYTKIIKNYKSLALHEIL